MEGIASSFVEVEHAGKLFRLRRLKNADWAQIHDHIRSRRIAQATKDFREKRIDETHYRFALSIVYNPTNNFTIYDDLQLLQVAEAQPLILWLSLRDQHPEITLEAVDNMFPSDWSMKLVGLMNQFYSEKQEEEWRFGSQEDGVSETDEKSQKANQPSSS